jgi:hypothetical protein
VAANSCRSQKPGGTVPKQWTEMDQPKKLEDLNDRVKELKAQIEKSNGTYVNQFAKLNARIDALTKSDK